MVRQDFQENLTLALDTLRAHKLRSFLTVLGVVIGVGIIIVVAALLAGFDSTVTEAFTGFGADTAFVSKFNMGIHFGRLSGEERMRKPLTLEDGQAILEECPGVKAIAISHFTDNGTMPLNPQHIVNLDVDILGSYAYPNSQIGTSLFLLSRYADVYPFEDLVTHTFGVDATEQAILASRDKLCVKAMVVSEP